MSKCISSHGEYSEHEGPGEYCDWCGDCNHAAIIAAAEQRGAERGWDEAIEHVSQIEADVGFMEHYKPHNPYRADRLEGDDE